MSTQKNRRADGKLREAIGDVQASMFDPKGAENIVLKALHQASELSEADVAHCSIFTGQHKRLFGENSADFLVHFTGSASIHDSAIKDLYKGDALPSNALMFNGKIPQRYASIFKADSAISASLFLPIKLHGKSIAFISLAKADGFFDAELIERLSPLIKATVCALQNTEAVRGSFQITNKVVSDDYISALISSSPSALLVVDKNRMICLCNPRSVHLFHGQEDGHFQSLTGLPIDNFFPQYDSFFEWSSQIHKEELAEAPTLPVLWERQPIFLLDGKQAQARVSLFQCNVGKETYTTLQIDKVVEQSESQYRGAVEPSMLPSLMDLMPLAILQLNNDLTCLYTNEMWTEISGLSAHESEHNAWLSAVHDEEVQGLIKGIKLGMNTMGEYRQELRIISPLGVVKYMDFFAKVILNDQGHRQGILCTFSDITEALQTTEKLTNVAHYDGLTGLANRLLFQDRLEQAFIASERERSKVCLFFLDLDGFKLVNDEMGHDAGDIILKLVAQRLQDILRRNDTIGRFGGDEFVILLGHDDHDTEVITVAEKIIKLISMPYTVHQREVNVTVSIGIAQGTSGDSNPRKLLKQADSALYLAKDDGKNNFKIFDEKLDAEARKRNFLVNQLRRGLKQNSFSLHYQPIIDSVSDKVKGFEALLRFTDVNNVAVAPDSFIDILEDTGLIVPVGAWVIQQVCEQVANWKVRDLFPENGYISFNVSAKQLVNHEVLGVIESAISDSKISGRDLVLEMTESVLIDNADYALRLIKDIKALGLRIALDDFGTGYSSLSYLQSFPFDLIKIDKSFILDLKNNRDSRKITKGIIALAHSLEIELIAEGVETKEAFDYLRKNEVELCQGFYFSRPLPERAIKQFLLSYSAKPSKAE
ncbi:EAL domain-containing protein [Glaciecola sp. MH2013]|uniref:putative bifunctional diguanylate cyclase/phosphodiesterase n=1 Tax=Glaciecola sp. MH2013 TaxID=2785524 RepID=UPI00189CE82B|nr:EAL domain-containing protein [Glaciecola sp. MH2013]MBF7073684.1 EAL domain-containing protein [Glaciecola sp. MH2013]